MRCVSCDCALTDFESTRKYADSNNYVDLCNRCLSTIPEFPATIERVDLLHDEVELEEDDE